MNFSLARQNFFQSIKQKLHDYNLCNMWVMVSLLCQMMMHWKKEKDWQEKLKKWTQPRWAILFVAQQITNAVFHLGY